MEQNYPNDTMPIEECTTSATIPAGSVQPTAELEILAAEEESSFSLTPDQADAETPNEQAQSSDESEKDELGAQPEIAEERATPSDAIAPQIANVPPANTSDDADDRCDIEKQPYNFDRCTVQIAIQLLPDDGDAHGRCVILGVRSHLDAPILRCIRWNELGTLPPLVSTLLDELRSELPAREQAARTALENAKQEKEQRRAEAAKTQAQRRAERGRSKTTAQKSAKATNTAPAASGNGSTCSAPTTPRAPLPAATTMEQTKQMGLF